MRQLRPICLALAAFAGVGCDPTALFVNPTGLDCTLGPSKPCPDGWSCDPGSLTCYSSDAGAPTTGTTGGTASGTTSGSSSTTGGATSCAISGQTYDAGAPNPANACQLCAPAEAPTGWSAAPTGTACDAGGNFCAGGACLIGCEIGGAFEPDGGLDSSDPCQTCQPAASTSQWSPLPDLTPCGASAVCAAGACTDVCVLDAGADAGVCDCASGVETCNGALADTCVDDGNCGGCANGRGMVCGLGSGCFGGSCTTPSPLPASLFGASALLGPDGLLYVIGGQTGTTSVTASVERYDPRANRWDAGPSLMTARAQIGAATDATGSLYALGGVVTFSMTGGQGTALAEVLRPGATAWTALEPAPAPFFAAQAARGPNGLFYLPGGMVQGPSADTQTYDPIANAWGVGPSLRSSTAFGGAAASDGGILCSIGGTNTLSNPLASLVALEQLPVPDGGWAYSSPMPTPRCDIGTAVDEAGAIYAIGGDSCAFSGSSGLGIQYSNIEVLVPGVGWLDAGLPSLANAVQGPACARGADGRIFCFAGYNGSVTTDYVQVYNPRTLGIVSSN